MLPVRLPPPGLPALLFRQPEVASETAVFFQRFQVADVDILVGHRSQRGCPPAQRSWKRRAVPFYTESKKRGRGSPGRAESGSAVPGRCHPRQTRLGNPGVRELSPHPHSPPNGSHCPLVGNRGSPARVSPAVPKARPPRTPQSAALSKGAAMVRAALSGRPPPLP